MRWMSTDTYKSPDVLTGDALSLYLFNKPLLPTHMVTSTLNAQMRTRYGIEDLATQNDHYLPASDFLTLTSNPYAGQVEELPEPGGWYQHGGSWLLWEYLAEYAAYRQVDTRAVTDMRYSIAAEMAVTPMSKEFKVTADNPDIGTVDPSWPYPVGSCAIDRQG